MDLPISNGQPNDLSRLVHAVTSNRSDETLSSRMSARTWEVLAGYLNPQKVDRGYVLISQGAQDRNLYFVESGILRVHCGHRNAELQIAVVGPGAVVGEASFFSEIPRNATVQATQASVLWILTPEQFATLSKDDAETALSVAMALGAVLANRMSDVTKRATVT